MSAEKLSQLAFEVKHYAEIAYPVGEHTTIYEDQAVAARTPDQIALRKGAIGFSFYDKVFSKQMVNGELVNKDVERGNRSHFTWLGQYSSLAQIAAEHGEDSALYRRLKDHGYVGQVRTVRGFYKGVGPSDKVLDPSQVKYVDQANEADTERTR